MPTKLSRTAIRRIRNLAKIMPLRDVARILGYGHSTVDRYAKGIRKTSNLKIRWQHDRKRMLQICKSAGSVSAKKQWSQNRQGMLKRARKGLKVARENKRRAREGSHS